MSFFRSQIKRGQTYTIALELVTGVGTGIAVRADLKAATIGGDLPDETVEPDASFTVVYVEDIAPTDKPGWLLTLSPAQTADLAPGSYLMDARLETTGGAVTQTEIIEIEVVGRITT